MKDNKMRRPVEIRKFRPADMNLIDRIERASFGKDAYDGNLFAELYHKYGDLFLVALGRSTVCGYMVTSTRGDRAEIISIAVAPRDRKRGTASALMESTLRRLRRRKIARVVLMVKVTNEAARRFYAKYGFDKVRLVRKYYEDDADGVLMARKL